MSIIIKKNDMDGQSVYVSSEVDLADVPESHRGLVGEAERLVLADTTDYFRDLAGKAKRLALRQWLKMLADCETWILELHTASLPGVEPDALFRFFLDNGSSPGVRLRSAEAIPSLPPALAEIYELIDGISHRGYGFAGELASAASIAPFSETNLWLSDTNTVDPAMCMLFYSTLNGDMLGFQWPDQAVWYVHEVGELQPTGSLRSLVDCYLRKLIQGDILERE